jgi:protein O-mannosyl-transferase
MQQKPNKYKLIDKYLQYLILSGIIILTLIIYSGTLKNGFTNLDDNINITDNKDIQNFSISGIVKIFSSFYFNTYKPIIILVFAIIYKIFGLSSGAFHSLNIFFHLINIILVYLFIYQIAGNQELRGSNQPKRNRIKIATFVSIFFAIHPMNTEAVCWISGLDNGLYTFFYLGSLIFYIKHLEKSRDKTQKSKLINRDYLISFFFFLLSLLSKPVAVTLPVILILIDYYIISSKFKVQSLKYWMDKIPFFLLALVFGILGMNSVHYTEAVYNQMAQYSFTNRLFLMTYSLSYYITNLILPIKLSEFHPSPELVKGFLPLKYYLSPFLILLIIFLINNIVNRIKKYEKLITNHEQLSTKTIIFGILFFLVTILLTFLAVKVRPNQIAERYTYIPYLGLFFILGQYTIRHNYQDISIKTFGYIIYNLRFIIVILFILIFSVISHERTKVWANSITLYNDIIEKYSKAYMAYNWRGNAWASHSDYRRAIEDYSKSIDINPKYGSAVLNRGKAKVSLGDFKGALDDFNKAIEINPENVIAFVERGSVKSDFGDLQGALNDYNKAIEINPKDETAFYNRGIIKYTFGDKQGALNDFNKAIQINPQYANAFNNRGSLKSNLGDEEDAIHDYDKAIEINPKNVYALKNRGTLKSILGDKYGAILDFSKAIEINSKDAQIFIARGNTKVSLGDMHGAIQDYCKAIEINPKYSEAFNNRGNAKASIGEIIGAIEDYNKVIELKPQFADAFNNRGMAKYQLGDKENACLDWSKSVELGNSKSYEMIKKYCK